MSQSPGGRARLEKQSGHISVQTEEVPDDRVEREAHPSKKDPRKRRADAKSRRLDARVQSGGSSKHCTREDDTTDTPPDVAQTREKTAATARAERKNVKWNENESIVCGESLRDEFGDKTQGENAKVREAKLHNPAPKQAPEGG